MRIVSLAGVLAMSTSMAWAGDGPPPPPSVSLGNPVFAGAVGSAPATGGSELLPPSTPQRPDLGAGPALPLSPMSGSTPLVGGLPSALPRAGQPPPLAPASSPAGSSPVRHAAASLRLPSDVPSAPSDTRRGQPPLGTALASPQSALAENGVARVSVSPGANNIFPVAQGYTNRIVTPFRKVGVSTSTPEGIEVRGGVVYVTPQNDGPVTMFMTEDGDESVAISVSLVPRAIPPVELELMLPGKLQPLSEKRERIQEASQFEASQSYLDVVREVMRRLAVGQVPPGYEMQAVASGTAGVPACAAPGFVVDFRSGQHITGSQMEAFVGTVRNTGASLAEFTESWCGAPYVVAVALSSSPMLAPGQKSEIFLLRRVVAHDQQVLSRPSLLGKGS